MRGAELRRRRGEVLWIVVGCLLLAGKAFGAEASGKEAGSDPWAEWGRASWLEPFTLSGWADTVLSARTRPPHDVLTSRARLRLECAADFESVYAFVSAEAEKNWKLSSETGVDLREAWLERVDDGWDLRVGRQIIIWGKADGVQITDIVSPPDYTESVIRELDEIRMPVTAAKLRLLGDRFDTEMIWIPFFKAAIQPDGDNPWAVRTVLPENVTLTAAAPDEPDVSLENGEFALKVSGFRAGLDVAASVFHTWDDHPAMHRDIDADDGTVRVSVSPRYHRMTVFGLEFSRPWSDVVFRGEAAYYVGRYRETESLADDPMARDSIKWLGGLDWTPGNGWTLIAQLTGEYILRHDSRLAAEPHAVMATLHVSRKLLRDTLEISNMVYLDMTEGEAFDRFKVEYAVTDAVHLHAGLDLFIGEDGPYGMYEENTQCWVKVKYAF